MKDFIITTWIVYKWTWIFSFLFLLFRSDIKLIYTEMKKSFKDNQVKGFSHFLVIAIVLPITLPFTLANILNKWL